jgi:hypothetical protein
VNHILSAEGLNLENKCCVCLILTPGFSWTWELQSLSRIRRLLQIRPQFCISIHLHGSMDSWFRNHQKHKSLDHDVTLYAPKVDPEKN